MKKLLLAVFALSLICANAAVNQDVTDYINNDASLTSLQKKAINQYAQSLDKILNVDLQNRDAIIATNKDFMNAQQCLAQVYAIDQKPYMMKVSRNVYQKMVATPELLKQFRAFLGQAQQEGDLALPKDVRSCK